MPEARTGQLSDTNSLHVYNVELLSNHPACEGHFEGNPILPGVVTLEYVRIAFRQFSPKRKIRSFSRAKFTHNLKPGEKLIIHFLAEKNSMVEFQCFDSEDHQIAIGSLKAE
ncbi:MAG TPA: hypothetical protein VEL47_06140 [Myxococcota bacterium]|nr:hypothetical protein [Myxococcota bacterium]